MNSKTANFFRPEITPPELMKLIRSAILEVSSCVTPTVHQINADSGDCVVAMKAINEKLSQHIEHVCLRKAFHQAKEVAHRATHLDMADSQIVNMDKMANALQSQMGYYETALKKLEDYKSKISKENYLLTLNDNTSALKISNNLLSKETNEARLRLNALVSKEGKEKAEKVTKLQDVMLRIKYYEEKIAKTEGNPEAKAVFLKKLRDDDTKVQEKLDKIRKDHGKVISDREFGQRKRATELRTKLEKMKSHNSQMAETARKQMAAVQIEVDRLHNEEKGLREEVERKEQLMAVQTEKVIMEEKKTGQQIGDVREFILRERRNQHSREKLRESMVKESEQSERFKSTSKVSNLNKSSLPRINGTSSRKINENEAGN